LIDAWLINALIMRTTVLGFSTSPQTGKHTVPKGCLCSDSTSVSKQWRIQNFGTGAKE